MLRPNALQPHELLRPGQPVHVNIGHLWLTATVTDIGTGHVGVDFDPPVLTPLARAVRPWTVRPATGLTLKPVDQLRAGDQIVAYDGTSRTAAAPPWQGHDRSWQIAFTDGRLDTAPAGTVVRVVDTTPTVTVNGQPL